ncbi:MAG: HD domain-containing protein, partial [bacterium]
MNVKDIISLMESPTKADLELVENTYDFAQKAHEGVLRKSGEPYFVHVYETAKILAELKMGAEMIAAGLLHDSIEDGVAKESEIREKFGDEVLFLVNGVTKLGKLKYRGAERYIGSLQKLFVASAQDIRVIIIKLADRLHNMRTLEYVRPDKQKRIALETLEIFAPLAYRLSIRKLSRELEDLSFPYIYPKEYKEAKELLKLKKNETLPKLEKFMKSVKRALAEEGLTNVKTDYRQKGLYSLSKKINKKAGDIDLIYDILAIRLQVDSIENCYRALGIIHNKWRPLPGRIKDYIAVPKPNGYQSIHTTVFTGDGAIVEVQIRTPEMHRNAEFGIASHLSYKNNAKDKRARFAISESPDKNSEINWFEQFLPRSLNFSKHASNGKDIPTWIKDLADTHNMSAKDGTIEDLKADFFCQRIFVFTPKGDVVDLPIGSSPIDFAYAIHSDVGNHISSVKVNGKMVALNTPLKNGDFVEIVTKKSAKPSRKWLDFSKTTMAKRHIKNALG